MLAVMSRDTYLNFAQLAAAEDAAGYRIVAVERHSDLVVLAPHGGSIEPGTSEIARAVAGAELSLYLFEGRKAVGNGHLHITSTRFDEPQGMQLVKASQAALAVHGESSEDDPVAYLGGRDAALGQALKTHLEAAGFTVGAHDSPLLQGVDPDNICNRGQTGAGVQLELSQALRLQFFPSLNPKGRAAPRKRFYDFVRAVRDGLGFANVQ